MSVTNIIGICIAIPSLISLIVLLYIISFKTIDKENRERTERTRMYIEIRKYFEKKNASH